jgi:hypothetical protein
MDDQKRMGDKVEDLAIFFFPVVLAIEPRATCMQNALPLSNTLSPTVTSLTTAYEVWAQC